MKALCRNISAAQPPGNLGFPSANSPGWDSTKVGAWGARFCLCLPHQGSWKPFFLALCIVTFENGGEPSLPGQRGKPMEPLLAAISRLLEEFLKLKPNRMKQTLLP